MPLETSITGIQDLNAAWPSGIDPISEGDNHVRNVKDAVQKSFPGMTAPWTTSQQVNCGGVNAGGARVQNVGQATATTDAARKGDIDALNARVDDNDADITALEDDVSAIDGRVTTLEANIPAIASGLVNTDGSRLAGTFNWSAAKESTGSYVITFDDAAATNSDHVLVATIRTNNSQVQDAMVQVTSLSGSQYRVVTGRTNQQFADVQFTFVRYKFA